MKLLRDFCYVDHQDRKWLAPKDSIVDGASIPRSLWSSIGSPYTDDYRRASIVHDVACRTPNVSRKEADEMFYYACIAGGCTPQRAAVLYAGVRIGSLFPRAEQCDEAGELGAVILNQEECICCLQKLRVLNSRDDDKGEALPVS